MGSNPILAAGYTEGLCRAAPLWWPGEAEAG
jgi:hypothetical protein